MNLKNNIVLTIFHTILTWMVFQCREKMANTMLFLRSFNVCKECGRGFKTSADLTRHSNVHSKQMTFVCDVEGCAKSYTRRDGATLHKKTVH